MAILAKRIHFEKKHLNIHIYIFWLPTSTMYKNLEIFKEFKEFF
jgi:hypothetical protein